MNKLRTGIEKVHLTSAHWGSYTAVTAAGKLKEMIPFEQDQDPSAIGQGIVGVIDDTTRITQPMVRQGWLESKRGDNTDRRGNDKFVALEWDEVTNLAGDE